MNFSGKYTVTEVREQQSDSTGRYVVLTPQHDHSGRTPDGCIELRVSKELVPEFALRTMHSVTISPVEARVREARPAGLIADDNPTTGENYSGLVADNNTVAEREARHADEANRPSRHVRA